ncbi:MAG: AmmeMemoRadiSam system radical SAM enzyme [Treponema sp.]|jgi:pyruvate formate lyase activating enzyme|nr:AmmeMemoRadiSam system radical SAM enzyme [Treponema sp.]
MTSLHPARFYHRDKECVCDLCPHHCILAPEERGLCRVRRGSGDSVVIPWYGYVTALAVDPVEKKPLYHWRPGERIFSVGFAGCNLRCPFCQNAAISQSTDGPGRYLPPEQLVEAAKENACESIAYTYSEPLVHAEYLVDCMKASRRAGIANVLVTNGCAEGEAAKEVLELSDAANIDLKCFDEKSYKTILGGDLKTVLLFIKNALSYGVHVEITTLVVSGFNDRENELDGIAGWIADAGAPVWHLSAYRPGWKYSAPQTDPAFLVKTARRAKKKLPFVYLGNIDSPPEFRDTRCTECNALLAGRRFRTSAAGLVLKNGMYFCASCGAKTPFTF